MEEKIVLAVKGDSALYLFRRNGQAGPKIRELQETTK